MFFNTLVKHWWKVLFFISALGVLMMWIDTYAFEDIKRSDVWKGKLILPFYFTHISNLFAVVVAFVKGFTKFFDSKKIKIIEVFAIVNLTLTLLVYWTLLFPKNMPSTPVGWITNMLVHLITPAFMIFLFIINNYKNSEHLNFNLIKTPIYSFLFLIGYLIMAMIIYYSLGAHKDDAIYEFLDFNHKEWCITVITFLCISLIYYGLILGSYKLINYYSSIN